MSTSPTLVFRGNRRTAVVGTVAGGTMLVLWSIPFYRNPDSGAVLLVPLVAGIFVLFVWVVFGIIAQRVVVSPAGVSIRQSLVYSTHFLWGDLASWNLAEIATRSSSQRLLQFHSKSTGCIHRIVDNHAWRPAFDQLVASIRCFAPERETEALRLVQEESESP
ncbi:MAG: hypothetical protein KBG84_10070 [Planctomycetes bacterium]|nr:hypothetical protein [Planctomycetota bacterium]